MDVLTAAAAGSSFHRTTSRIGTAVVGGPGGSQMSERYNDPGGSALGPTRSVAIPLRGKQLIRKGLKQSRAIDCFDFVPSNYGVFYRGLASLPRGVFYEWGSGMGIATALAELLGFQAHGIEINDHLADASRKLLNEFGFRARIDTGDYFLLDCQADTYFAYCWPGQVERVKTRFDEIAPPEARLLVGFGAEDIRCLVRA